LSFPVIPYVCLFAGAASAQMPQRDAFASLTAATPSPYEIRITPPAAASAAVSLHTLRHKPPRAARRELERAVKFEREGDRNRAIGALRRAVAVDPEYMQAWNNLGVQLLRANYTEPAVDALRRAIQLDPEAALAQCNLSAALGLAGKLDESEQAARRAIRLDPSLTRARYLLALSLFVQRTKPDEAVAHLSRIAGEYPRAHRLAAALLWQAGRYDEAQVHFRSWEAARSKGLAPPSDRLITASDELR
jgi:tetratricopeptide (TPR) repeat protein